MLNKIVSAIKKRIYCNETIIVYVFRKTSQQNIATDLKIYPVADKNLKDVLSFQDKKYIEIFNNFLKVGDAGYYAYLNSNCVHRSWVKSNEQVVYFHWSLPYRLKNNEVFIHYCETAPNARGKNVFPRVLDYITRLNKNKEILISVNRNNQASIRGVQKAGFEKKESIQTIVLMGIRFKRYLKQ